MQDELTTSMHAELLAGEETPSDMMIMGVYGAMMRYDSLKRALADYPMVTEEMFLKNVTRALGYGEEENERIMKVVALFKDA